MFFQQHTADTSVTFRGSSVSSISLSTVDYLDAISDIKTFKVNTIASITPLISNNTLPTNILDAITALSNVSSTKLQSIFNTVETQRTILNIGNVSDKFDETLDPNSKTGSLIDAPYFNSNAPNISIDFRNLQFLDGRVFPAFYFSIFSELSSNGPYFVGSCSTPWGNVPIYSSVDIAQNIVVASMSIEISERFSDIVANSYSVSPGSTLTFTAQNGVKGLSGFKKAFFAEVSADVIATDKTLSLTVPTNAKSGPVRFEQHEPLFNAFYTADITVT